MIYPHKRLVRLHEVRDSHASPLSFDDESVFRFDAVMMKEMFTNQIENYIHVTGGSRIYNLVAEMERRRSSWKDFGIRVGFTNDFPTYGRLMIQRNRDRIVLQDLTDCEFTDFVNQFQEMCPTP